MHQVTSPQEIDDVGEWRERGRERDLNLKSSARLSLEVEKFREKKHQKLTLILWEARGDFIGFVFVAGNFSALLEAREAESQWRKVEGR